MQRTNEDGTIKHLTIHDSGDSSVGIMPSTWVLSGEMFFDKKSELIEFEARLCQLISDFGFIDGKVKTTTDVEEQAIDEAERTFYQSTTI